MQVKLVYDGANGDTEMLSYLQLDESPAKGQILDVGGGIMLEVVDVTATPESTFHKALATVRPLNAVAKEIENSSMVQPFQG